MRLSLSLYMHAGALAIASRQPSSSSTVTPVTPVMLPLATVILPPLLCHICSVTTKAAYVSITAATSDLYSIEHDSSSISNISTGTAIMTSNCTQQDRLRFTDNALSIVFRWLIRVCVQSSGTAASTINTAALSKAIDHTILHVVTLALDEDAPIANDDNYQVTALADNQVRRKIIEHNEHEYTHAQAHGMHELLCNVTHLLSFTITHCNAHHENEIMCL
jgi:hypothetical protein